MGGAVCIGQPQQKVMKLKAQGGNTEGMQVINNFDYEEFAFEREGDNNNSNNEPSKVKAAGGNPNRNNNVNDDNNNEGKDKDEGNNNNGDNKDGGVGEGKNGDGGEMKKDEDGQRKDKEGDKSGEGVQQQQHQQQQQQATEEEYQMEFRAQTKTKAKRANENEHKNEDGHINNNNNNENANTNTNANMNNQAVPSNVVDNKQQQQQPPQQTEVKNNNNNNNNNSQSQNKTNVNNPPAIDNSNNNNNNENKEVDTTTKKSFYKQSRKNQFPDIYSVIPEKLLTSCDGNELLFISDLKKMININAKERVKYSDRFCMVTKDNFILYNSKENYITLKRPLAILPINQITRVVLFKLNPLGIGYDHFYICFDKNSTTEIIYQQINTFFMNGGATIAEEGVEGEERKEISPPKENEVLLMFKSENSELIKKWYVVLNYLIGIAKGKGGSKEKEEQQKEGVQQG